LATSLVLRVFTAPLTHHHLVIFLNKYNGSGFGREEFTSALDENATENDRLEAATADFLIREHWDAAQNAIEEDDAFERAIKGLKFGERYVTSLTRSMQVYALAPHLPICESHLLAEDHPVHEMVGRPIHLSIDNKELILSAFADDHPHLSRDDAEKFFDRHYGATAVICRD
jgi:hypothetical protein